ncbi:hemolysin family protein [Chromatium okenii]|uniref:hemolysin family protein n=1 Tax=Chromatium okenii TaxID=61644 RepID=UPI0026F0A0BC|nr:hemolysin family protein [Chromatium okenii]MBV5309966.1 HlyC/CorC family transporter [Chromatium okenii]
MEHNFLLITVAFLLVLLNGFFVAAEFGLVKLRQTRIKAIAKTNGWRGRVLIQVHQQLDTYLSACQLGITLASLGLGWIGEPAFAQLLHPLLILVGVESEQLIHTIAFSIAFFMISYLHIVVGELAPKSIAIRFPDRVGVLTAAPLYAFYWLMYPLIWILNHSSNWLLKTIKLDNAQHHETYYSTEELKVILRASRADDRYTSDEWRALAQALDFRNLEVADLMRPFREAIVLLKTNNLETNLERVVQHRYSRYPYVNEQGQVEAVIHLKDIFFALRQKECLTTLDGLARPVLIVSPSLPASDLLRRFRQGAPHFAVIAYQEKHPLGFITLDNLLGALVGEIRDEFRQSQNEWMKLDDDTLIGKGSLSVFTLERALGIDIEETTADSVGGLILQQLGDLPEEGQRISFEKFDVVVKKMSGPRIMLVRIYPQENTNKM